MPVTLIIADCARSSSLFPQKLSIFLSTLLTPYADFHYNPRPPPSNFLPQVYFSFFSWDTRKSFDFFSCLNLMKDLYMKLLKTGLKWWSNHLMLYQAVCVTASLNYANRSESLYP